MNPAASAASASSAATARPAVFLDRDGTLIEDRGFLAHPDQVRLLPGVTDALSSLHRAGFALVTVSNQSGIARGLYTADDYERVARRLDQLLESGGACLDARYYCPHHPEFTGPCECRKPGLLHYQDAARGLGIDCGASWWVGDRLTDLAPARLLNGRGILVLTGAGPEAEAEARAEGFAIEPDLAHAAGRILAAPPGVPG